MTNAKIKLTSELIEFNEIISSDINAKKEIYNLIKKYLPISANNLLYLFKEQNYDLLLAAYDKNNNKLIGCIAAINKGKLLEIEGEKPIKKDFKTMYIDYVVVDEKYTSNKIGTTLINKVQEYAKQNKCVYLSLNCPINNAYCKTVYDDNDFNRINVNVLEPRSVEFRKNISSSVICYGKLAQGIIAGAKNFNYDSYENFKTDILKNQEYLKYLSNEIGLSFNTVTKMINNNIFENMMPLFATAIDEHKSVNVINNQLNKIKREKILLSDYPFYDDFMVSMLDSYRTSAYSSVSVNFIGQCLDVVSDIDKNNQILISKQQFLKK